MAWSTILIVILCAAALVLLAKVFGYLIEQRKLKRQRELNRERLHYYRSQEWED